MTEPPEQSPSADPTAHLLRKLLTAGNVKAFNAAHKAARKGDPRFRLDLTGLNLTATDLRRVELEMTNCAGVELTKVNFGRARLKGSSFAGARLTKVNFAEAILKGADFSGTTLIRINFVGADLSWT